MTEKKIYGSIHWKIYLIRLWINNRLHIQIKSLYNYRVIEKSRTSKLKSGKVHTNELNNLFYYINMLQFYNIQLLLTFWNFFQYIGYIHSKWLPCSVIHARTRFTMFVATWCNTSIFVLVIFVVMFLFSLFRVCVLFLWTLFP